MRVLRQESYRLGVALSTGLNIAAKGLSFFVNILVAAAFGLGEDTDVYYFCLGTIMSLVLLVTSIDSSVVIPEIMRAREQDSESEARGIVSLFFVIYLAVGMGVSMIILFDPVGIIGALSGFSLPQLERNEAMLVLFIVVFPLMILATYSLEVLATRMMFSLPMIASLANSIVLIFCILLLKDRLGLLSAPVGLVAGYGIQLSALLLLMYREVDFGGIRFRGVLSRATLQNIGWAQLGNLGTFFANYLPLLILSSFGNGAVTALSYGQKLAEVPSQLLTNQVSSVAGIRFNELAARRDEGTLWSVYKRVTAGLVLVMVPTSVVLFINKNELLALVFGRGAFDMVALGKTSDFFQYLCFLSPFIAINTISARLLMAKQMIRQALAYQLAFSVLMIVLTFVLTTTIGPTGYAIAILAVFVVSAVGVRWFFGRLFPALEYDHVLSMLAMATALTGVSAAVAAGVMELLPPLPSLLSVILSAGTLYVLFMVLLLVFHKDNEITKVARRVFGPRP